jgi:hypothetical protein
MASPFQGLARNGYTFKKKYEYSSALDALQLVTENALDPLVTRFRSA